MNNKTEEKLTQKQRTKGQLPEGGGGEWVKRGRGYSQ